MPLLSGKRALIVGVASNRSIAWGIAQAFHREGAELAFTYQGEKLQQRVVDMAATLGSELVFPMDVGRDEEIEAVFDGLKTQWSHLDIIIHAVAFAPRDQLSGRYIDSVTRDGFKSAHDISAYSFAALARAGRPMMQGRSGALLTLSYLGAVRALPHYNVMGPAKASLEANVRFLAQDLALRISASTGFRPVRSRH
jgi:enoyl-[acyl-carrier protein] reductase I